MKISSNITAAITNNYLSRSEKALTKSMTKLSSGFKVNHSSDNPAGYAISSKMKSQIESLKKAVNNSNEGINALNTAESAMAEIQSMLQRMTTLTIKASNGTNTTEDRAAIQDEIDQLKEEIDEISKSTEYNSMSLLDGSFNMRAYIKDYIGDGVTDVLDRNQYITSTGIAKGEYEIKGAIGSDVEIIDKATGKVAYKFDNLEYDDNTNMLKMTNSTDSKISMTLKVPDYSASGVNINDIQFAGYGELALQTGSNEGQTVDAVITKMSCSMMGLDKIDCRTEDSARDSITMVEKAVDYVSRARSKIGAYQNRLESRVSTLEASVEDLTKSFSTIMDTDMAEEMTEFSRLQVLEQAGMSMLTQANQFPQEALQLLQ